MDEKYEPTAELRYLLPDDTNTDQPLLQQAWRGRYGGKVEWRAVERVFVTRDAFRSALREQAKQDARTA